MKPETRARTSTEATASKRPENSSHCVTRLATGGATSTCVAGGPPRGKAPDEGEGRGRAASGRRGRRCEKKSVAGIGQQATANGQQLFPPRTGGGRRHVVVQRGTFNCLAGNRPGPERRMIHQSMG